MRRLLLLLLLALPLNAATIHYLVATDPAWVVDVWAINRGATDQSLGVANCGLTNTVLVPARGSRIIRDAAHTIATICVANNYTYVTGGDVNLDVFSIARNVNGMRLYVPGIRTILISYGTGVSLDVLNFGEDVARLYVYQNGTRPGPVTFIVRNGDHVEIAREVHNVTPGRMLPFLLTTPVPSGGSVLVTPGFRLAGQGAPGINDPNNTPDGEIYVFSASGVESGASAPFISVPTSLELVP